MSDTIQISSTLASQILAASQQVGAQLALMNEQLALLNGHVALLGNSQVSKVEVVNVVQTKEAK